MTIYNIKTICFTRNDYNNDSKENYYFRIPRVDFTKYFAKSLGNPALISAGKIMCYIIDILKQNYKSKRIRISVIFL